MSSILNIPRFAIVGRVNKGKSSLLATLVEEADNERIRVSNTPGETTRCQPIPLVLQGEKLMEFIDTPGFNQARKALDWMQKRHQKKAEAAARIDTVREFVDAHKNSNRFEDECLLLTPVLEGAGILYVIDASKPFRDDFLAEMEILRWTGRPRMAIINNISAGTDFTDVWRQHLGEYFNLTRTFNAHTARFRERIRLLKSLLEIEEKGRANIEKTIQILDREWEQRRGKAADVIMDLIETALSHRSQKMISSEEAQRESRRDRIVDELTTDYLKRLQEIESAYHKQMVALYRHGDYESVEDTSFAAMTNELFSQETWEVFGLNQWQLGLAAGLAGAASGGAVDVATGGHTGGLGAIIGGLAGLAATVFKGRALADVKITNPVSGSTTAGGVVIKAGPPRSPNFPWILLDRALYHFEHIIGRAHGRRDVFVIDFAKLATERERMGRSAKMSGSERRALYKWFNDLTNGKTVSETGKVFDAIRKVLDQIEQETLPEGSRPIAVEANN